MYHAKHLRIILFFSLCNLSLIAQSNSTLWFSHLDKERNLSSNKYITDVYLDSKGFTWISTFEGGLNQFDGRQVKHFRADDKDSTSLSSDQILGKIFEDENNNLWFSSIKSIESFKRNKNQFQHHTLYDHDGKEYKNYHGCFDLERDSFLWGRVGLNAELFRYNIFDPTDQKIIGKTDYDVDIITGSVSDGVLKYIFSIDGSKSTGLELFELNRNGDVIKKEKHFSVSDTTLQLNIHSIIYEHENEVWLSTSQGLYQWNMVNAPKLILKDNYDIRYSIRFDSSSLLINTTNKGLLLFNIHERSVRLLDSYLTTDISSSIGLAINKPFSNSNGNLWMEYRKKGLVFSDITKSKFRYLPKKNLRTKKSNYSFRSIIEDKEGNIWYSTYPIGLLKCDKKAIPISHFLNQQSSTSLPSDQVIEIYQDDQNNLWIGTEKCAAVFDPSNNQFVEILDEQNQPTPYIYKFLQLSNGTLLVVSLTKGVYKVESSLNQSLKTLNFKNTEGYDIAYEDDLNQLYLGFAKSEIEVYKIEQDSFIFLKTLNISGTINGFHEDDNGKTLWVATTEGLVSLDKSDLNKKHLTYTTEQGLVDNAIQSMAVDRTGNIWLGTKGGLNLFNPTNTTFYYFSKNDGSASTEYDEKSVLIRKDGSIWFGGNNGITIIDEPENITFSKKNIRIQITDFKINDEHSSSSTDTCYLNGASNITEIKYLKLPPNKNTVSFNFTAIDYGNPATTQLKYQLEPYDKNWVQLERGENGFCRYTNLPSGDYTLKIKAANSDSFWHPDSFKELKITITPKLIERLWFQLLLCLLGIFILLAIYKNRIYQIQEKAYLKTRAAENKMAALIAQMNPHFAFNSLQSLNGIIASEDMLGAFEYVSQFSDLMRMMLENSRENKITLDREIHLLKLYIEIEAIRFSIPFKFKIKIDEELKIHETIVPAMLLQPFVENAIKHGLFHKKSQGNLLISFTKENDFLKCTIQDDGVGRDESKRIKAQKGRKHTSRGLEIVKERLEILRQSGFGDVDYQITDLFTPDLKSMGTKVTILLPN